jgi:hypothetical protein
VSETSDALDANSINEWRAAGRLLQWALQLQARPVQEEEYMALVKHYLATPEFQRHVDDVARGLGLLVQECDERGLILTPLADSVFAMKPADFRPTATSADLRFIDGLIQVAVAATVFPRSADLDEDRNIARPPITVADVEHTLHTLCEEIAAAAKREPDPAHAIVTTGLVEGWRVWSELPEARETASGRRAQSTRRRYIEQNLDWLVPLGCFQRGMRGEEVTYRATYRYQAQVQDFSSSDIYDTAQALLRARDDGAGASGPSSPPTGAASA